MRFLQKKFIRLTNANWLFDFLFPALIVLLIYTPNWKDISGSVFLNDQFIHWDGFAIRQTLALRHGLILGRDLFIQYGILWPMIFSQLFRNSPLLYGSVIHTAIIYASLYYIGVYIFLRLITRNIMWSILGMVWLLHFQLFIRNNPQPFLWETPSSTILRSPMDIWFFITSYFVIKSAFRNVLITLMPAVFIGLAILFEFDTGIYLAVIHIFFSIYFISKPLFKNQRKETIKEVRSFLIRISLIIVIILSGFLLQGKSSLFQTNYWRGLFEGLIEYATGVSNLPFATLNSYNTILLFELIIFVYLFFIAIFLIKFLHQVESTTDLFFAGLSLYGLESLFIFLSRSHRLNLLYPTIPFWILITWIGVNLHKILYRYFKITFHALPYTSKLIRITIPSSLILMYMIIYLSDSVYQEYPNLINQLFLRRKTDNLCLFKNSPDVCGLSEANKPEIEQFNQVTSYLKEMSSQGNTIAIIDDTDTMFYVAIDVAPFFRYRPGEVFTKKQLQYLHDQIINLRPDFIMIDSSTQTETMVIRDTRLLIGNYYNQDMTIGKYEIWKTIY